MGPAYWILYTALLIAVLFPVAFFSYFTQKVQESLDVMSAFRNKRSKTRR